MKLLIVSVSCWLKLPSAVWAWIAWLLFAFALLVSEWLIFSESGMGHWPTVAMNILDHSGHSRGFPSKLFNFSFGALVGYCYLNNHCYIVDQLWGKLLGLQHLRNGLLNCAIVWSDSAFSQQGCFKAKGDSSRALVDWERTASFSNAVLFTLRSRSGPSSISWYLVSSSFICISSSSLLRTNSACSSRIMVSNSISNFFILSSRLLLCWRILKKTTQLFTAWVALLCSAFIADCVPLFMYASQRYSKLSLHVFASFRCSSTNLLGRVLACFDASVAWVLFPLEGEQSADRVPLVCWVYLIPQLFCSQVFV